MRSAATTARRRGGARSMELSLRAPSAGARGLLALISLLLSRHLTFISLPEVREFLFYSWAEKGGVRMVERNERHNCCASTNSHHTHTASHHAHLGCLCCERRLSALALPPRPRLALKYLPPLSPPQGLAVHAGLVEPRRGPGARWTTSSRSVSSSTSSTSRGTWRRSTACSAGRSVRFRFRLGFRVRGRARAARSAAGRPVRRAAAAATPRHPLP